ncbi:phage tail protein [Sphingomonas faeni]|uniref:phage tail protein n=1 Tax=Sphingomonas faeni TaxID=185950 RepID=UPI0020C79C64|nr:phage tail protein [Sphingomonas faeni]MCP8893001.1 phage tail protein [Sphingomonas faeni]
MSALKLVMTTAGLGRFTAAQAGDDIDLTIARVGLTDTAFVAAPSLTALPGEFRRLSTVSGSVEAENVVHMTVTDDAAISYTVRGFGLFLTDGTLFAAYS